MAFGRTVTGWLLVGLLGGALAEGCGSSSNLPHSSSNGAAAGGAGKDSGSMTVEPPGNSGNGGESQFNPLCGIPDSSSCVPDLELNGACAQAVGGTGGSGGRVSATGGTGTGTGGSATATDGSGGRASGTGGVPAASGTGGTGAISSSAGEGGEGGVQSSEGGAPQGGVGAAGGPPSNGGATDAQGGASGAGQSSLGGAGAGEAGFGPSMGAFGGRQQGTAGGSTSGGSSSVSPASGISCQVTENPNHKGSPLATCRAAGTGTESSPCFSGADCAPTFACVGDGPGQCRPYCCSGPSECLSHTGTHCTVAPLLLDAKSTRVLDVPVCMPPVQCSLAEKYPCTAASCSCPTDSACVVVGDDGATSCMPVSELPSTGMGALDQPCPCAPGFVCSQAKNTCVALCEVAAADATCGSGRCQASAALPAGWGTCVGTAPKAPGTP